MRQLASFLLLLCPLGTTAQSLDTDTTQTIKEVVVNGFRISGNVLASSPVQTLSHADMERLGIHDMGDALKRFAGVQVKDYGGVGSATADKRDFIRSHTKEYMSTTIKVQKTKPVAVKNEDKDIKTAENLDKSGGFSKEQLELLKKYKDLGMPISKIANPKLSVEQMEILMQLEKAGANCSYFADPEASVDTLKFYLAEALSGSAKDVENYVYLDLDPSQLAEVSLGYDSGVDYPQYADKLIPATEMSEIRIRLESGLWHNAIIPADDMFSVKLRYEKSKLGENSENSSKFDNKLDKINSLKRKYRA